MATIHEAFAIGVQHHQAGRLQAAEQLYRQILDVEPQHAEAIHLLGVIALQAGKHEIAVEYIRRAIGLNENAPAFHNNLGKALMNLGKQDEAIARYRRAVELKPDYALAHDNLGNAFQEQGKLEEAVACYRRALDLNPNNVETHCNLGVAFTEQGDLDEAVACFRRTLELKPDSAEAHYNLGNALQEQGKLDDALVSYRRALELKPDYAEAYNNLGNALQDQGKLEEAIASYRRALELKPDHTLSLGFLVDALQHSCCWKDLAVLSQRVVDVVDRGADGGTVSVVSPLGFLASPTITTAEQQLRCASRWADRQFKAKGNPDRNSACPRPSARKSKITIGYLSADFHSHPTAVLIAELLEKHDRRRYSICGYSYGPDDGSALRQRLAHACDRFVDVQNTSFVEAARRISADEVDILVDLQGYTAGARTQILAFRPAPIQVNYLGYPGTMGAEFMDYILVDDYIVPVDQQPFFTEKLVHLPGCYQVNDSQRVISPRKQSRKECKLPAKGFVFCSFNNSYKITPEIFDVWVRLLKAVPGSVLWLLEGNQFAACNLRKEAEARGVDGERLVVAPWLPLPEHLARYALADLFLDTFPVNARTTASDALWTGLPLLTLSGQTFASRVSGSLLRTMGLPELITTSLEDYEAMALRLAGDRKFLAKLRARLKAKRAKCGLFDGNQFARKLERAYATMWEIYASGEQPRPFVVSPNKTQ